MKGGGRPCAVKTSENPWTATLTSASRGLRVPLWAWAVDDAPRTRLVDEGAGSGEDVTHTEHEAEEGIVAEGGEAVDLRPESEVVVDQVVRDLGPLFGGGGQFGDPLLERVALDVVSAFHRSQLLRLFLHPCGQRAASLGLPLELPPGRGDEQVVGEGADGDRQRDDAVVPAIARGGAEVGGESVADRRRAIRGQKLREGIGGLVDSVVGDESVHVARVVFPVLARIRRWGNGGQVG